MPPWLIVLLQVLVGLILVGLIGHTIARVLRHAHRRPMPHWFAPVIDNPLRRLMHSPDRVAAALGIEEGMRVLEVGPGHGSYTLATARRIGESGKLVAVDIQEEIVERLKRRAQKEGITNLEVHLADVHALPFDDGAFDLVYMITVIGEIPDPVRAMREFHRVLVPGGRLALTERILDPDYPLTKTLIAWAGEAGFGFVKRTGNLIRYTLFFEKPDRSGPECG